jgi:hypothetical protein
MEQDNTIYPQPFYGRGIKINILSTELSMKIDKDVIMAYVQIGKKFMTVRYTVKGKICKFTHNHDLILSNISSHIKHIIF